MYACMELVREYKEGDRRNRENENIDFQARSKMKEYKFTFIVENLVFLSGNVHFYRHTERYISMNWYEKIKTGKPVNRSTLFLDLDVLDTGTKLKMVLLY